MKWSEYDFHVKPHDVWRRRINVNKTTNAWLLMANFGGSELDRERLLRRNAVRFYHLSFHVQGNGEKALTQLLPFSGSLIDRDYILQEDFNQTCRQPGSCFHFVAAGFACVCVCGVSFMTPELILQLFFMVTEVYVQYRPMMCTYTAFMSVSVWL